MSLPRRYADWRPVAVRRMPARWIGLLAGAFITGALSFAFHRPSHAFYMVAVAAGAFVSNRIAARRLAHLRDEGDDRQFGATLRLKRETVYGLDEGLISFEDGYLVYMGRRCAFSLGARDVRVRKVSKSELEFDFRGPGGKHTAHFELSGNDEFLKAIVAWKSSAKRSAERVLPPARPDPSLSPVVVATMGALPMLVLSAVFAAIRPKDLTERPFVVAMALVLLGVALLYGWSQLEALARIRKENPRPPSVPARWRMFAGRRAARRESATPERRLRGG